MCLLAGASAASSKGETDPGKQLLLAYLADRRHGDTALSSAATESMLCQSFASAAAQCQNTAGSEEEHASLLVDYRLQLTSLRRPAASPLTESECFRLPSSRAFLICWKLYNARRMYWVSHEVHIMTGFCSCHKGWIQLPRMNMSNYQLQGVRHNEKPMICQ